MPLVGDLIVRTRNIANDPCQTLGQPVAPTANAVTSAGIFSGTIYGYITYLTQWGETTPSSEVNVTGLAGNAIALTGMVPSLAATMGRFYYGAASGQEQQYVTFIPGTSALVGTPIALPVAGIAPYKSSAYLPDTDGDLVSAYEIYRWINAGLSRLGRLAGGILDQTGVAMQAGSAEVVIPGWWLSIKYTWHNGWLVLPEQQSYTWLQSPVNGIPGISTLWRNGAQQVLGVWPQPATAPALTVLTKDMGQYDTVANVQSTGSPNFSGTDGAMSFGSAILNSATGGFTTALVEGSITVNGAGPYGNPLSASVVQVYSPNQLLLSIPAQANVTGAGFSIESPASGQPSFTAPGMCQIDQEIMSYSIANYNTLTNIVRGYSGTIATFHPAGMPVSQLIFRLLGRRMPVMVIVGQSANTLDLPMGWDEVMDQYLISRFKSTEQNTEEASALMKDFEAGATALRDDNVPLASKQLGGLFPLGGAAATLAEVMDTVVVE